MKKEDAQLGLRVRFRNALERRYVSRFDSKTESPRKEWLPATIWGGNADDWRTGIVVGVRSLADGDYDHGGYDEQPHVDNREYFTAILVVEDLRKNPLRCRPEDVELVPLLKDEW